MAVKLIANYAKRLGLPGFSSHQFSVSVETELVDLGNAQGEATRLYGLLQDAVDREIQHVGFVPPDGYGLENTSNGNGATNNGPNGSRHNGATNNGNGHWSCSYKQKELILKIVEEHGLDRNTVDELAHDRFGAGVRMLNKLQASGLISELIESTGPGNGNGGRNGKPATSNKGGRR
jgi:hypothetical protein